MFTKLGNKNKLEEKHETSPLLRFVVQLLGGIIVVGFGKWCSF